MKQAEMCKLCVENSKHVEMCKLCVDYAIPTLNIAGHQSTKRSLFWDL